MRSPRRYLRDLNDALVAATSSHLTLLHVNIILKQVGEYTGDPAADLQRILTQRQKAEMRAAKLESLIRDLADDDDCAYDHNGCCQTHYRQAPCPHKQSKAVL